MRHHLREERGPTAAPFNSLGGPSIESTNMETKLPSRGDASAMQLGQVLAQPVGLRDVFLQFNKVTEKIVSVCGAGAEVPRRDGPRDKGWQGLVQFDHGNELAIDCGSSVIAVGAFVVVFLRAAIGQFNGNTRSRSPR